MSDVQDSKLSEEDNQDFIDLCERVNKVIKTFNYTFHGSCCGTVDRAGVF